MTQELVLGVLITGLVGFIWVIALSVLSADQPTSREKSLELAQKGSGRSA